MLCVVSHTFLYLFCTNPLILLPFLRILFQQFFHPADGLGAGADPAVFLRERNKLPEAAADAVLVDGKVAAQMAVLMVLKDDALAHVDQQIRVQWQAVRVGHNVAHVPGLSQSDHALQDAEAARSGNRGVPAARVFVGTSGLHETAQTGFLKQVDGCFLIGCTQKGVFVPGKDVEKILVALFSQTEDF